MNLDRIPEKIVRWIVSIGAIAVALYGVKAAANMEWGKLGLIALAFVVATSMLVFREKIWMLIPVIWPLSGQIPTIPIPFTVRDFAVMIIFGSFLLLKAFKLSSRRPNLGWLDFAMMAMLVYITAGFIRNPVGVDALNAERVGGRPYFNVFIGFLAFWVLSRCSIQLRSGRGYPIIMTVFRVAEGVLGQLLLWIPALGGILAMYYMSPFFYGLLNPELVMEIPGAESTKRLGHLLIVGQPILFFLFATERPLTLLNPLHIGRFCLLIIGVTCVLLSGFRSALVLCCGVAMVSAYFFGGMREVARMVAVALVSLSILVIGNNTLFELPRSAQRALSFLPGKWDQFAVAEAKGSTEWRVEMWREMLGTNRFIDSHMLGDGFGFKKRDLEMMRARKERGLAGDQEDFMITGGVHSGPVSSVRYVGYIGLALYLVILCGIGKEAWILAKRAKGTSMRPLVFLIGLPAIVEPFQFVFVFGAFESSFPESLFVLGMLRMLRNSMDEKAAEGSQKEVPLPDLDPIPSPMSEVPRGIAL